MRVEKFEHQFVKSAPRELEEGILYVSLEYCTMLHSCACGCGRKVVTPLSPKDWSMTFDGHSVSVTGHFVELDLLADPDDPRDLFGMVQRASDCRSLQGRLAAER